jgi:DNA polymerase elongation subunit (family B)
MANMIADQFFYCESVEKKTTKTGKSYLDVQLVFTSGAMVGKVWEEAMSRVSLEPGKISVVSGTMSEYQGKPQLDIKQAELTDEDPETILSQVKSTPTLVFDIETVGQAYDELEVHSQEYLLTKLEHAQTDADKEQAKTKTGLYPIFGSVVAIGLFDTRQKGTVLLVCGQPVPMADERFKCEVFADEKSLLTRFWEIAKKYERFVSYNGKGFDWPYLVFRSGVNRVKVTIPMNTFSRSDNNIDLMREIMAGRSFSLAEVSKALGTFNPKAAGVSGGDVNRLVAEGKQADVAQYVARDVVSTGELYEVWRQYMAGRMIL